MGPVTVATYFYKHLKENKIKMFISETVRVKAEIFFRYYGSVEVSSSHDHKIKAGSVSGVTFYT